MEHDIDSKSVLAYLVISIYALTTLAGIGLLIYVAFRYVSS